MIGRLQVTAQRRQRAAAIAGAKRLEVEAARLRRDAANGFIFPVLRASLVFRATELERRAASARAQVKRSTITDGSHAGGAP